jgi:hypothetical protein
MRASDDPDCDGVAWKYVSEFQKSAEPNIALRLLDVILRQLKQGSTEPVLIASETLSNLDKLSGQKDNDETSSTRVAGPSCIEIRYIDGPTSLTLD